MPKLSFFLLASCSRKRGKILGKRGTSVFFIIILAWKGESVLLIQVFVKCFIWGTKRQDM